MPNDLFERIKKMAATAGTTALELIDRHKADLKEDQSVITEADTAISKMVHEQLDDLIAGKEHLLIDEEDPRMKGYFDQSLLDKTPYIWSVDPIDGTRLYANRVPLFGISIGLMKDLKPWMGAVFFPMLKELFYCDGQDAYFVENAFSPQEKKRRLANQDETITARSLFLCDDSVFNHYDWDDRLCQVMISSCAVVDLCWPTIGRGCGAYFKSHLWDFAGSWPIARAVGLELRSVESGKTLDRLDVDFFLKDKAPWKVREGHILSTAKNFPLLKENLKKKK